MLAIPHPSGRMRFVELATGRVTPVDNRPGDGWQAATWISGSNAVLALSVNPANSQITETAMRNRIDRVDLDGDTATLYDPTDGFALLFAASHDGQRAVIAHLTFSVSAELIDLDLDLAPRSAPR